MFRVEASVMAVKNCKLKAAEIARTVCCRLGPVIGIREENTDIWTDDSSVDASSQQPIAAQQRIKMATMHITSKLVVTFELRQDRKSKTSN